MILKIVKIITLLCLHKILKYCANTVYYVVGRYMLRRNYTVVIAELIGSYSRQGKSFYLAPTHRGPKRVLVCGDFWIS